MYKREPQIKKGKDAARLNVVRHGALSDTPVIPGLEGAEEWEAHRAGIFASVAPEGYLEEALAARVALLLWRLGRIARYEQELVTSSQEWVERDLNDVMRRREIAVERGSLAPQETASIEEMRAGIETAWKRARLVERLPEVPQDAIVDAADWYDILFNMPPHVMDVLIDKWNDDEDANDEQGREDAGGIVEGSPTAGALRDLLTALATRGEMSLTQPVGGVGSAVRRGRRGAAAAYCLEDRTG